MKHRYFIKLAYNGAAYHGWQQQENALTVQQVVEESLSVLLKSDTLVTGCGRTDTGVHAREFYAHFDTQMLDLKDQTHLKYKLNSFLPSDIVIFDIIPVKADAHARFSALSRTYQYVINTHKDPFNTAFSYYLYGDLDTDRMNEACLILHDYLDFTSFSKLHTQVKTNNCKISHAQWVKNNSSIVFTIQADRFLRNMVRAIVGTMIDIGRGKINLDDFRNIIESKNRSEAGTSVPAHALFLSRVEYPGAIFVSA